MSMSNFLINTLKKARNILNISSVLLMVVATISEDIMIRALLFYITVHILFGPLDWYLIYKLYLKLKEVIK